MNTQTITDQVHNLTNQAAHAVEHANESTTRYIKEEPLKAVLIAAATGAALMALLNLVCRASPRA